VPVPRARKQAARQLELVTEWTLDRIRENREINEILAKVQLRRRRGYPDVTPTTRALLDYWGDSGRDNPILFCQREAAETAIVDDVRPHAGVLVHFAHGALAMLFALLDVALGQHPLSRIDFRFHEQILSPTATNAEHHAARVGWAAVRWR
jgi:hypothetical protein